MSEIRPSRRAVLTAAGLVPLATLAPALIAESKARAAAGSGYRFFTTHQAAVVKAAAARLIPGPGDDPVELALNSPGATEADVVRYIDTMLSLFDDDPPKIFAGGPYSNRHPKAGYEHEDYMKHFVHPAPRHLAAWKKRVAELRKSYTAAVKTLDSATLGKDFAAATSVEQDNVLKQHSDERDLIFQDAIDGMYSVPEYGGNKGGTGWKSISFDGDVQPTGYTAHQVEKDDGPDPIDPADNAITQTVLKLVKQFGNSAGHADRKLWTHRG